MAKLKLLSILFLVIFSILFYSILYLRISQDDFPESKPFHENHLPDSARNSFLEPLEDIESSFVEIAPTYTYENEQKDKNKKEREEIHSNYQENQVSDSSIIESKSSTQTQTPTSSGTPNPSKISTPTGTPTTSRIPTPTGTQTPTIPSPISNNKSVTKPTYVISNNSLVLKPFDRHTKEFLLNSKAPEWQRILNRQLPQGVGCELVCEGFFGVRFFTNPQFHDQKAFCKPTDSTALDTETTKIICGGFYQYRSTQFHQGIYCDMHNLYADMTRLAEIHHPDCRPDWPPPNPFEIAKWFVIPQGALGAVGCEIHEVYMDKLFECVFPKIQVCQSATEFINSTSAAIQLSPSERSIEDEETITIMAIRDEFANIFHSHGDWLNAYMIMRLNNISRDDCQILLMDHHPSVAIDDFWNVLCAGGIKRVEDYQNESKITRFRHAIFNPGAYGNLVNWYSRFPASCNDRCVSEMLVDWRHKVLTHYQLPVNWKGDAQILNLTLLVRNSTKRNFNNLEMMLGELEKIKTSGITYENMKFELNFSPVWFEDLSVYKQLEIVSQTDIFMAMHGAGCTHLLYIAPHAVMAEFVVSGFDHYKVLSAWSGRSYVECRDPNRPSDVHSCALTAIEEVLKYKVKNTTVPQEQHRLYL